MNRTAGKVQTTEDQDRTPEACGHIAIVSINKTECQCMDCLRIWEKDPEFISDYPEYDRG